MEPLYQRTPHLDNKAGRRTATGPKVTLGHILVITYPIIIKFEDYITYVKVIIIYENQLICLIVAMATAIDMVANTILQLQ